MKRVLILGAGTVGLAVGQIFLDQGCRVALCDDREAAVKKAAETLPGLEAITVQDLTSPAQVEQAVNNAAELLGGIDLYAHTLTYDAFIPFAEMSPSDYREVRRINLDAPFLWGQTVGKKMAELGNGGEIVYTFSDACTSQEPEEIARCATHWAAKGLIRSMAVVLGHKGIAVNAICPGALDTPEEAAKWAKMAAYKGITEEAMVAAKKARSLTGTLQTAEEVAELYSFLANEAINISGQALLLDGGASFN